jgi:hypothetical protein
MERDRGTHAQAAAAICLFWFARSVDSWRFLSFLGYLPERRKNRQESPKIDKKRRRPKAQRCSDFSARVAGALARLDAHRDQLLRNTSIKR